MIDASFTEVFASALHGTPTVVVRHGEEPMTLPVDVWSRSADHHDRALVGLCVGPTIDVGCGPGRLTEALAAAGHIALGIDVVDAAVSLARARGVPAVKRDVFDRVPGEGRWTTALLADGNVGIGGDPVALLRRVRHLLGPGGRVVVEVDAPGMRMAQGWASLESTGRRSRPFRWATLGLDDLARTASSAGLTVRGTHRLGDRHAAVLSEPGEGSSW
ncbi:hypothetical protein ASC64_17310 [Nocardioides sp. Root122]|uniref:methyltransferase domain-containing protein n=1 Tax=Nocardioides TaxID=1839 RepID=UPI00070319AA|nr:MULTISPECIES: methyltransferase domain-containing protein [Nocardioides]KQV63353.1 hypothetical protein ASC64_17310 [Nocardioides sp. Root122]MCK9825547.1 class I SAM-dependent methyltransferase [Nocardioides cavernae]